MRILAGYLIFFVIIMAIVVPLETRIVNDCGWQVLVTQDGGFAYWAFGGCRK